MLYDRRLLPAWLCFAVSLGVWELHINQGLHMTASCTVACITEQLTCCGRAVLSGSESPDAWDRGCVGTPCPVSMAGGTWRLYYSGRESSKEGPWGGIGMALTDDSSDEFEGIKVSFKRGRQA